ncbi:MAG: sulfatase-like hydrolase/transferase [Acidobacteria bacterium]|nr:sulfatase-like hydrolase/transferase [Acidobacteriota bacterium]
MLRIACVIALLSVAACGNPARGPAPEAPSGTPRHLVIITIDTMRADRLGAYGYAQARTPAMDELARTGVRFERAFAPTPITLPSHASLMTGLYPPGHGARHNGMRVGMAPPTLAERFSRGGFATGAFVAAFPLDRRFGLARGFDAYGDQVPRGRDGRQASERPGHVVVDEALSWLKAHQGQRLFLWLHLFEPHAPYGDPADRRPATDRYDDEIAEADRQVRRLLDALPDRDQALIVLASDHGEAFGEHGEIAHSIFVYDTTLRVPLILSGPGLPRGIAIEDPVSLVDVAPTLLRRFDLGDLEADGVDIGPLIGGGPLSPRGLYAESFAPLLDFGWSALRSWRVDGLKYIAAPKPELYDVAQDPGELRNIVGDREAEAAAMAHRVDRISAAALQAGPAVDPETTARLQALGYLSGTPARAAGRIDPKDRKELAARIAQVTSGELQGPALEQALRRILEEDPGNPQAHLRLGWLLVETGRCERAVTHFSQAVESRVPSADAHLGLAACHAAAKRFALSANALAQAERMEPGNPVVAANLGVVLSDDGRPEEALAPLLRALSIDAAFHEARFNLAIAYARAGQRERAADQARELLARLPPGAPQRSEVQRLLDELQK